MPSPSHLAAVADNARRLRAGGDLAGARLMLEHALETARPVYGEDHPEVLLTAHLLASVHREMDDPAGARRVLEEALAAGTRRFGEGEPTLLAMSFDLGAVAEELGNRHEARRNFGRVAAAGPAALGADHRMVRAAQAYLGGEGAAGAATTPPQPATPPYITPQAGAPTSPIPPQATPPYITPQAGAPTSPIPPQTTPAYTAPQPPVAVSGPPAAARHVVAHPEYQRFGPAHLKPSSANLEGGGRGRTATFPAIVAAVAAIVAAVLAAVAVLRDDKPAPVAGPSGTATTAAAATPASAAPPGRVRLSQRGGEVGLSWADPADGRVPFVVTGGRRGERQTVMAQLDPGVTSYRVNGLNPRLDYCFTVIALYSATELAKSDTVCTRRRPAGATGSPVA